MAKRRKTALLRMRSETLVASGRETVQAAEQDFTARNPGYPQLERFEDNFASLHHMSLMMAICMGFRCLAEDVATTATLYIWRWLLSRPMEQVIEWHALVRKATHHAAIHELADRLPQLPEGFDVPHLDRTRRVREALHEAIHDLPDIYREVYISCAIEGNKDAETAEKLQIKEGTVKSRLWAARRRLRDDLISLGFDLRKESDIARTKHEKRISRG